MTKEFKIDKNYQTMDEYKRLWIAVIQRAVIDIKRNHERHKAIAWIRSENTRVQSFVWCCQFLNIDPDIVRIEILKNWKNISNIMKEI